MVSRQVKDDQKEYYMPLYQDIIKHLQNELDLLQRIITGGFLHTTGKPRVVYTLFFFILIYLTGFSDLLSGTSSGGLWFILVSVSTSVLIKNTKTLFDFWFLYSSKFPCQLYSWRSSHLRHSFITVLGLLWLTHSHQPIRELLKSQESSLVDHITGYFPWLFF